MLIYQPQNGYCYNSDSIILFYFFNKITKKLCKKEELSKNTKSFLDIGSGSGILGLLIKQKYPHFISNICEKQDVFCILSQKNYQINNFETILYKGDFATLKIECEFDYIISNPPFYNSNTKQCENTNKKIARYDEHLPLNKFFNKCKNILSKNGLLFFCYPSESLEHIKNQADLNGLKIIYIQCVYKNKFSQNRLSLFCLRHNIDKLETIYLKNIYSYDKNNNLSKKMNKIYKYINIHSIKVDM